MPKLKNKSFLSLISITLALLTQFTALTPISVSAGGTSQDFSPFITNVTLTITDSSGNTTYATLDKNSTAADSVNIPKDSTVTLNYDYSIPDDTVIGSGDQYGMTLPALFSVPYAESGSLGSLGTYTFNTDNSVSVTFGSGATGTKDRHGTLGLTATFKQSEIGPANPADVTFFAQDGPIIIPINFQQPAPVPPVITKSTGGYNASDGTVSWTITVKASGSDLDNVVVHDTLGGHQALNPGSVSASPAAVTASQNGSAVDFSVGSMAKNTTETITYTTTPDPDAFVFPADTTTFTNSATLTADGIDPVGPANAQTTVDNQWITKSGTYVDGGTQSSRSIKWTIGIDPDGRTISGPFTVTDTLPNEYLTVTDGTVTVGAAAVYKDHTADPVYYTLSTDAVSGRQTIVFHFQNGVSASTPIVFSTAVDPAYFNGNGGVSFDNTATIANSGGSKSATAGGGTVGLPAGVIGKTGVSGTGGIDYDASTRRMTWQLTVDDNKVALSEPVITDTLDDSQEFYQGPAPDQAIRVSGLSGYDYIPFNASGGTASAPCYTLSADKKTIKVYLPDVAANQADIVLKYQTLVTDPDYYAANNTDQNSNKVGNAAELTTANGVGGTASASEPVISTVVAKSGTGYDYSTRQIGWKVTVDQNVMPMTNAAVTDPIQDGQAFVENGGVKVDAVAIGKDAPLPGSNFYYTYGTVGGKPTLTVYLGSIGEQHVITFSTQVTDLSVFEKNNQNVNFYNTAALSMDGAQPVGATGSEPVTNWMLRKGDTYAPGNLYIDWWVHINGSQIPMDSFLSGSSITLTDTLQKGLDLDTASVRLYPMVSGSGNPSGLQEDTSRPVAIPASSIRYDPASRVFTFTLPAGLDLSRAYSLDFRTFVTDQSQSPFVNSVAMTGTASGAQGQTSAVTIVHYSNQGTGYGTTGSVTVNKTDGAGTPLDGAVFDLLDWRGEVVREETSVNGRVVFDRLDYSDSVNHYPYTVAEKTPPANYNLADPCSYTFTLDRSGGSDTLHFSDGSTSGGALTFLDSRKTGTIKLTKADQAGRALAGAVFTLYDAGGSAVGDPQASGPDGLVTFGGVPYGVYTVRETGVPADYTAGAGGITADLTDLNSDVHAGTLDLGTVANTIKTAGIQLTKLGAGGEKLGGATFTLYDAAGGNAVLIGGSPVTATSDAEGLAVFQTVYGPSSIPYGDYVAKETAPPADYAACAPIPVSLHDSNSALSNGVLTLGNVSDALKVGSITFIKLDENGNGLGGAVFMLKDAIGNPVGGPQTSGRNGTVTFTNVPYGDGYSVTETQAPADYTALSAPITGIGLHSPQIILQSVSDSRRTGVISFTKVDENGNPLAGAEFTLYDPSGKQVGPPQVSDEYGRVAFAGVPFRDGYTIKETKAPENYAVHAAFTVSLHTDGYDYGKVADALRRGDIRVKKTDPGGRPLAGSTFTLYDAGGKTIGRAVSDSKGIAVFAAVPYGDYTVRETAAPAGYGIDTDEHKVSLDAQDPAPVAKVVDEKIPLTPNPGTGGAGGFPPAEAGVLALASSGIVLSGKMRFRRRKEK